MRKEITNAQPQTEKLSAAEALNKAEALIESSRYKEAREKLQGISQTFQIPILSQESYRFHYLHGLLFFRLGDQLAAGEEIEEALRIFRTVNGPDSIPELENLPDFVKDNFRKLRDIEIALLEGLQGPDSNQSTEKTETLVERISEIRSTLENLNPLAKLHFLAGSIKIHLAKLDEAMEHLERATTGFKLSKNWSLLAHSLNGIAHIHFMKGEMENAFHTIEKAKYATLKTGDPYFYTILSGNQALCQLLQGSWKPAILNIHLQLEKAKENKDFLHYSNGLLYQYLANRMRGHFKAAQDNLNEAFKVCIKNDLVGNLKIVHEYFGELCLSEGRLQEAEEHLNKAIKIGQQVSPQGSIMTMGWRLMGELYIARKEYRKALQAYATCRGYLFHLPEKLEEGAMCRGIGIVHFHQGQPLLSRRNFQMALSIYQACGNQWEKAKTLVTAVESGAFTKAEMEPDIAWAKEVFKRLEHPAWTRRARALLKKAKNSCRPVPLPLVRERTEREQIIKALLGCNGNITKTAKKLGLLRQTLQYKIRHYSIEI